MEQTTYVSRLRYLDADDLDDSVVDFDGLDVRGSDGEKLGEVDGFLVDPQSHRVLYTVVDSGGWFSSRRFLLPIGHTMIDRDSQALLVDVSRQALSAYPEFDERRFNEMSDADFRSYQERMASVCCTDETPVATSSSWNERRHYQQPGWWPASAYAPESLRPIESRPFAGGVAATGVATATGAATAATLGTRGDSHTHGNITHSHPGGHEHHTHEQADLNRERVAARGDERSSGDHNDVHESGGRDRDDVSPHFGGRAQPGDILGIETGGETTSVGDTAEDENKRRRTAEKTTPTEPKR